MSPWESFFSSRSARRRSPIIMKVLLHVGKKGSKKKVALVEFKHVYVGLGKPEIMSVTKTLWHASQKWSLCTTPAQRGPCRGAPVNLRAPRTTGNWFAGRRARTVKHLRSW